MKRGIHKTLSRINPVRRTEAEGPALAVGDELLASIVAEGREASPAGPVVRDRQRIATSWRASRRRTSRVLAAGVACLALGGTAMAAVGVWDPGIGSDAAYSPPPSISTSPIPAAVTAEIGVLRREPDAADRGPAVEATLRELGSGTLVNIQPDSVRFLEESAPGEATILFSGAGRFGNEGDNPGSVCVGLPGNSGESGGLCSGLGEIMAGEAFWAVQKSYLRHGKETAGPGHAEGLVPDGVASVTVTVGNGAERSVAVHDNYFRIAWDRSEAAPSLEDLPTASQVTWHDASGAVIPKGANK
jgi:hypothetical protein